MEVKPCGYVVQTPPYQPGRMKELLRHYKACPHPECKARLDAAATLAQRIAEGLRLRSGD